MLERAGLWLQRRARWIQIPYQELELLRESPHQFLAQKLLFALVGLFTFPLISAILWMVGIRLPVGLPVIGTLLLAAGLSFIPDFNVKDRVRAAREEFVFVLGDYIDLIAMERKAATSPRQSMEEAARVGDSWVFARIAEELAHSRLSGVPEWDRLTTLGDRYGVQELSELGHIMKIASDENAAIYETLAKRAEAMRDVQRSKAMSEANKVSTKRSGPVALLGLVFVALLIAPAILAVAAM